MVNYWEMFSFVKHYIRNANELTRTIKYTMMTSCQSLILREVCKRLFHYNLQLFQINKFGFSLEKR